MHLLQITKEWSREMCTSQRGAWYLKKKMPRWVQGGSVMQHRKEVHEEKEFCGLAIGTKERASLVQCG